MVTLFMEEELLILSVCVPGYKSPHKQAIPKEDLKCAVSHRNYAGISQCPCHWAQECRLDLMLMRVSWHMPKK